MHLGSRPAARLTRRLGLRGVMRGKVVRITVGDAQGFMPARPSQPSSSLSGDPTNLGQRFHVRLDLAELAVRGLRHRFVCQAHRWLTGEQFNANRLRARCAGAGSVCAAARTRWKPGLPLRHGLDPEERVLTWVSRCEEAHPACPGKDRRARAQCSAKRLLCDRAESEMGNRCHRVQYERPQTLPVGLHGPVQR